MKSERTWLSELLIQPLMIILSILAALAVNQWQESRTLAQRVAEARVAFANEIKSNRDLLLSASYLPHHRRLQAEYLKASKGETADSNSFFETGVHPTPLRDSAWRVFSGSAVLVNLPPHILLDLSDIYRAQDSLEKQNQGFLTAIGIPRSDRETPAYAKDMTSSIALFLNDLVSAEERLLQSYERTLDQLGPRKNSDTRR
jgi:hypothetical protein